MLKISVINFVLFIVLDIIWWGFIAKNFFTKNMSHLARMNNGKVDIFYPSAIMVYVVMSILLTVFVIKSQLVSSDTQALFYGALFGFGMFVTFDFTNHALISKYPIQFALVDVSWGTFMCGIVAYISYKFV